MRFFLPLFLFLSTTVFALPVGNPADASLLYDGVFYAGYAYDPCEARACWRDALSLRFGYYGDFVFDRHMEVDQYENTSDIERTRITTNAGFLALNGWEKIDLFATLGATKILIDANASVFGAGALAGTSFELETESSFSWSLGLRGTLWECGCTLIGAEVQYFYSKPHITRATDVAAVAQPSIYPRNDVYLKYREWQIGIGAAHRFMISCSGFSLVPYIALKWSRALMDADHVVFAFDVQPGQSATIFNLRSRSGWGYAVGATLIDCDKMSLTVEGRFAGEKALFVNGQIRF